MSLVQKISFGATDNSKWSLNSFNRGGGTSQPADKTVVKNDSAKTLKTAAYVSSAAAVTALGIAAVSLGRGKGVKSLTSKVDDVAKKVDSAINLGNKVTKDLEDTKKWYDSWIKAVEEKAGHVSIVKADGVPPERNLGLIDNLYLIQNVNNDGKRIPLDKGVTKWLQNAADKYINGKMPTRPLTKDSTVWSLTFESIPEKKGGLGEVPVQIAKNFTKEFGIDNYIVRPMTLIPGQSQLIQKDGKYIYSYNLHKDQPFVIDLEKVAEFKTNAFRNGKYEEELVEVFTGWDKANGHRRLMFKNNDYFTASGLYDNSQKSTEAERCAFFPKLAYEFGKYLKDPASMTDIKVFGNIKDLKAPDAMILNDWHAAAMAGLARLKAPVEASRGELSQAAAEHFKTMTFLNLNHNLEYQGVVWDHRKSDVINTLFDKYAFDIYENANTKLKYDSLKKVLTLDGNVNLANIGACLANKMSPVSPNYAKELAEQDVLSHGMHHICQVRLGAHSMEGRSNGWDRAVNELSEGNVLKWNSMLNADKFTIVKNTLKKIPALSTDVQKELDKVMKKGWNAKDFKVRIEELRKIGSPSINKALDELEGKGVLTLRELKPYTYKDSTETILLARKHNKQKFFEHLRDAVNYTKETGEKVSDFVHINFTDLSKISTEELDKTVVITMGARFAGQKGVDTTCKAIEKIIDEWPSKYPNKPQPIFVIGGADDEGGKIAEFANDLKLSLGAKGERVLYNEGYTSNPEWQAGGDFTWFLGHFEPDGAKWESLYKGTPAICTRVGGQVDSIQDGVNGFLTSRTVPEIRNSNKDYLTAISDDVVEATYRAIDTFYDPASYARMVRSSIDGNQSWVIKDQDGKITGGALLAHMKDLGFNLSDFSQIKLS